MSTVSLSSVSQLTSLTLTSMSYDEDTRNLTSLCVSVSCFQRGRQHFATTSSEKISISVFLIYSQVSYCELYIPIKCLLLLYVLPTLEVSYVEELFIITLFPVFYIGIYDPSYICYVKWNKHGDVFPAAVMQIRRFSESSGNTFKLAGSVVKQPSGFFKRSW